MKQNHTAKSTAIRLSSDALAIAARLAPGSLTTSRQQVEHVLTAFSQRHVRAAVRQHAKTAKEAKP